MKINYDQAEMINATDYHDAPKWSLAYCLAIAARYERLAYQHPDDEECAMQAWWWRELARGDYSTPRLHYFAGMALETWPLYGVWEDVS